MSSRDFHDILNDCIERMAAGQAGGQVRRMLPEAVEIRADQGVVWQRIEPQLARQRMNRRRKPGIGRLLLAAALLTGLLGGAYFALNQPPQDTNVIEPLATTETPTTTYTATPSATFTPTVTYTPSPIPSATPSSTSTPTATPTYLLMATATPFPTALPPTLVPTVRDDNSGSGSANSGSDDDGDDDDNSGHGSSDDDGDDDD